MNPVDIPNIPRRKLTLFAGTTPIGTAHAPVTLPPTLYICPECGEIWGRAVPEGGSAEEWSTYLRRCPRHPLAAVWWATNGSFLQTAWLGPEDLDRDGLMWEVLRLTEKSKCQIK